MTRTFLATTACLLTLALPHLSAAEYFVSRSGNDADTGLTRTNAFATIQRGVDALRAGDTLTILPGEYHESVRREGLGTNTVQTTIRAEIPGTVILRGDVPAPPFRPVEGEPFVYVADLDTTNHVPAVNELDTLTILQGAPNAFEPAFMPGTFHHDAEAGKLYIASSDWRPPSEHRYTVTMIDNHGFYLGYPTRVTLEGLTVTGFYADREMPRHDYTLLGTWGLFLTGAKHCVIRDCRAYMNAQGIGINSLARPGYRPGEFGSNVIEGCVAWANGSPFGTGDRGGITLVQTYNDVVRDSHAFLNGEYGINIRSDNPETPYEERSRLIDNMAWGNGAADVKIKTGHQSVHTTERTVAMHPSNDYDPIHCLLGHERNPASVPANNIILSTEENLDPEAEFADPANRDYRLQATSRFRNAAPDGSDKGPYPFEANVFFVKPDGDDRADGVSVSNAWKTLPRAVRELKAGDTLYLLPGTYAGALDLTFEERGTTPISIRGRGTEAAVLRDAVRILGAGPVAFQRIRFEQPIVLRGGLAAGGPPHSGGPTSTASTSGATRGTNGASKPTAPPALTHSHAPTLSFSHCHFTATNTSLRATGIDGIRIEHCAFSNFTEAAIDLIDCRGVDLRGNWFDNTRGPAIRVDDPGAIRYSGYNGYADTDPTQTFTTHNTRTPNAGHPSPMTNDSSPMTNDQSPTPLGPFHWKQAAPRLRLVDGPRLYAAGATTANIEWRMSLPAVCGIAWGETPACTNRETFQAEPFATYSLTGLEPDTTYYLRLTSLRIPRELAGDIPADPVELQTEPVAFTTLKRDPAPRTLFVAPDGSDANDGLSRGNAWRTIQHAANSVRPGDTVHIAGGTYTERVRLRVTGAPEAPITFACLPGERVHLSGADKKLNRAFIACGKSHLRFDGFYFKDFNREPLHSSNWRVHMAANFLLYKSHDIQVSRCLADGRGGYSARFIVAWYVEDLDIRNCVIMNKMSGSMILYRCPGLHMEHTVICRPMITSFHVHNEAGESATMTQNIFTDMLAKKARANIGLFYGRGPEMRNNCYFLREFPPKERHLYGDKTAADLGHCIHDPIFADPKFAGDPGPDAEGFPPDRLTSPFIDIDFHSFFATNSEVVERGIGLEPEAFREFDNLP